MVSVEVRGHARNMTDGKAGLKRNQLRKGVLGLGPIPDAGPCSAGQQPPHSGLHFSDFHQSEPLLIRFPPEILKQILGYLEAIWLFQVEAAYAMIGELLSFENSNRLWYDAVPDALLVEPEKFQDEALVKDWMLAYCKAERSEVTLPLSWVCRFDVRDPALTRSRKEILSDIKYHYKASWSTRFVVPALTNLSELASHFSFSYDIKHPADRRFYPTMPTRVRVMALGGPFQPWLDYRQELAGQLHSGTRCIICFEIVGLSWPFKKMWGMNWCVYCYHHYMLSKLNSFWPRLSLD